MAEELTIAIPFYRGLDYLTESISSVIAQSHRGWRLLVCDDSEGDAGAREVVSRFGDASIAYFKNPQRLGMVANWNQCIDRAETDRICLLHADDRLHPSYTGIVLDLAKRHPDAVALFCEASIIGATGEPQRSLADAIKRYFIPREGEDVVVRGEAGLQSIMAGNYIMCPTLCMSKTRLGERRFSERWLQVQDLEFTSRLLMDGETLVGSRSVGYAYRRHAENATARQSESLLRFDEEFRLFSMVSERAQQLGWAGAARVSRRATIVRLHLLYRSLRDAATGHPTRAFSALRFLLRRGRPGPHPGPDE